MRITSNLLFFVGMLTLILVFQMSFVESSGSTTSSFVVRDEGGNPLPNALVLVEGITNTSFSESKLTDSNGKISFSLSSNEFFVYIIYKQSYVDQTASLFTNTDKTIQITLKKVPDNQWQSYILSDGNVELQFQSLDNDTNYDLGDYLTGILEIRNVGEVDTPLLQDESSFQVIDAKTMSLPSGWGDFDLSGGGDLQSITLKKSGWIRLTFTKTGLETCGSNIVLTSGGQRIELSEGESVCISKNQGIINNKIPSGLKKGNYQLKTNILYQVSGQTKNIGFTSQNFFINGVENTNNNPTITTIPNTQIDENMTYTYDVNATDTDGDVLTYSLTTAPEWLSIDSSTGVISGTSPSVSADTEFSVISSVSDGNGGTDTQTFALKVHDGFCPVPPTNNPPVITSSPIPTVNEGVNYLYGVNVNDADGDILTYSLTSGPTWLSINSSTGLISGIAPSVSVDTSFSIEISVNDGHGGVANQDYTLTVKNVKNPNSAPVIVSMPVTSVSEGNLYSYDLDASDSDGDSLEYSLITAPEWLSINSSTGIISGTAPSVLEDTPFNITAQVSDLNVGITTQNYVLIVIDTTIVPTNNNPQITTTPNTQIDENMTYTYDVNATDTDGDVLTYSLTTAPEWLSIDSSTGIVTGTSPIVSSDTPFTIVLSVSDGKGGTDTQNYTLTVKNLVSQSISKKKSGKIKVLPRDEFYEQKYLAELNKPEIILNNEVDASVYTQDSVAFGVKRGQIERLLQGLMVPLLVIFNLVLILGIAIIIPTKINSNQKNITLQ